MSFQANLGKLQQRIEFSVLISPSSSVYYLMGALLRFVRGIAMLLCGFLMKHYMSAMAPFTVVTFALNIVLALYGWRGERKESRTRGSNRDLDDSRDDGAPFLEPDKENTDDEWHERIADRPQPLHPSSILIHIRNTLQGVYRRYIGRRVFRLGFLIAIVTGFAGDVHLIHTQWMAIRYNWSYAFTNYIKAYATFAWTCVLLGLPSFSAYLLRRLHDTRKVDLSIVRLSFIFKSLGLFVEGVAPTTGSFLLAITIQALGAGQTDGFKSFLTGFSSKQHTAELYAVLSQVETLIRMFSSRIWAWILIVALKQDRAWMGWPYWLSALIYLCVLPVVQTLANFVDSRRVTGEQLHEISTRRA